MTERLHEIVVFGATGFTGRLVAARLAAERHDPPLRWAIAGRDRAKLDTLAAELAGSASPPGSVVVAEAGDPVALARLARDACVVLSTAGPFVEHGGPLLAACVEQGADYVDITGEPDFVGRSIERFDARARERGLRIVHCAGFDSVPADLGTLHLLRRLRERDPSVSDGPITVEAYVRASATFSGGTLRSALGILASAADVRAWPRPDALGRRSVHGAAGRPRRDVPLGGWVAPLPTIDPRVVLRTAAMLAEYGPDFRYGHYALAKSGWTMAAGIVAAGIVGALAQQRTARAALEEIRRPGEGPSAERRARSWFSVTLRAWSAREARKAPPRLSARVSGGDPGYDETAKMASQSALCLARDRDVLPERAGVLTPAAAMEERLIARLVAAGMRFEVID